MPVFEKRFFESDIIYVNDLLFELSTIDSFNKIPKKIKKTNFFVWAGLRHSIPPHLKNNSSTPILLCSTTSTTLTINGKVFDVLEKKSKDYYVLFLGTRAKYPNNSQSLKREFQLTDVQLEQVFILPHTVCFKSYVKSYQYKVLNNILYTNTKLHKLGFTADDRCSFCKFEPETLENLLFYCTHSKRFWKDFESYFHSLTNDFISIILQDMLIDIAAFSCPLLNYLLLNAKIYIWDCRRTHTVPNKNGFRLKVRLKYEAEKYIYTKNNKLDKFKKKWALHLRSII